MKHDETEPADQTQLVAEAAKSLAISESEIRQLIDQGLVAVKHDAWGRMMVSVAEIKDVFESSGLPNTSRRKSRERIRLLFPSDPSTIGGQVAVLVTAAVLAAVLLAFANATWSLATATPSWISDIWSRVNPPAPPPTPVKITDHPGEPFREVSFVFDPDFVYQGEVANRIQLTVCATTPHYYIYVLEISPNPHLLVATPLSLPQGCDDSTPAIGVLDGDLIEIRIGAGESREAAEPILVVYRLQRVGNDIRLVSIDGTPTTHGWP